MSTRIGAGAITPVVSSASAQVVAGPAIPVYVYTSVPSGGALRGGRSLPVKFITSGDLVQNGGQYQLAARYSAMPVIVVAGSVYGVQGGVAIPVYDVTNLDYPPSVVIPPPVTARSMLTEDGKTMLTESGLTMVSEG